MNGQENIVVSHVDVLVQRLLDLHGAPTNAVRWVSHATYDIIVNLCFGEGPGTLSSDDWDPQVRAVLESIQDGVRMVEMLRYVPFKRTMLQGLLYMFGESRRRNFAMSVDKIQARTRRDTGGNADFGEPQSEMLSHLILTKPKYHTFFVQRTPRKN